MQSRTCSGYAEARKRRMKINVFDKPSAEPNLFGLCRGEKTKKISTFSISRAQSRTLFELCRGEKTKKISTFSISRAQSRTCSGYAEARKQSEKTKRENKARKQSEKIQLLTERSYVRTFVFTSRFPRSVYVAGNLYRNRSGAFVVGDGLSASGSTVDGVRRGTRFRSVVGIG